MFLQQNTIRRSYPTLLDLFALVCAAESELSYYYIGINLKGNFSCPCSRTCERRGGGTTHYSYIAVIIITYLETFFFHNVTFTITQETAFPNNGSGGQQEVLKVRRRQGHKFTCQYDVVDAGLPLGPHLVGGTAH